MTKYNIITRRNIFFFKYLLNRFLLYLGKVIGKTLHKPLIVNIQITKRCNAKCIICSCWQENENDIEVSLILSKIEELRKWLGPYFCLQIAGGEPLLYKGIFEILNFCSKNKIICKITTNGLLLTEENCIKLIDSKIDFVSVSIDSHIEQTHNYIRGSSIAYQRAIDGIRCLSNKGRTSIGISVVLMKQNIDTLIETIDFFQKLPISKLTIKPYRFWNIENISHAFKNKFWINDIEKIEKTSKVILKRKFKFLSNSNAEIKKWSSYFKVHEIKESSKKCHKILDSIIITSNGDFYFGCLRFGKIDNIKHSSFKKYWKNKYLKDINSNFTNCNHICYTNYFIDNSFKGKVERTKQIYKYLYFYNE